MISKILIPDGCEEGYAYKKGLFSNLPHQLNLTPGINVIFGPNGSGKSTLLKMIARYTTALRDDPNMLASSAKGGWYHIPWPIFHPNRLGVFPPCTGDGGPIGLVWDGNPVYWSDCTQYRQKTLLAEDKNSMSIRDYLFAGAGSLLGMVYSTSCGESTREHIDEILESSRRVPSVKNMRIRKDLDQNMMLQVDAWRKWILGRQRSSYAKEQGIPSELRGGLTYIIDEPETHLDPLKKGMAWGRLMAHSTRYNAQMIVASVSPVVLFRPEFNLIETVPGYAEASRTFYRDAVNGNPLATKLNEPQ